MGRIYSILKEIDDKINQLVSHSKNIPFTEINNNLQNFTKELSSFNNNNSFLKKF
jgi:hypothetical protein